MSNQRSNYRPGAKRSGYRSEGELEIFVKLAPDTWLTPQGALTREERERRLAILEKFAVARVKQLATAADLVTAYGHLNRSEFVDLLLGAFDRISLEALEKSRQDG